MRINYNSLVKTTSKCETGEIFIVEEYLGLKNSSHKYKIRFVANGMLKEATYSDIKNNTVKYSFRKIKTKKRVAKKVPKKRISTSNEIGIFALDIASRTSGYSIFIGNNFIKTGVVKKTSSDKFKRINSVVDEIIFRIKEYKIDVVVIEDIYLNVGDNSVKMFKTLSMLQGVLICRLIKEGYKYELVLASVWKSKLFGKLQTRELGKNKSIQFAESMIKYQLSEDEAEAFCIGLWYLQNRIKWEEK